MTDIVETYVQLPEQVDVPCSFGRLTRMRASRVRVHNFDTLRDRTVLATVFGRGVRKDGSLARISASARVQLPGSPWGEVPLTALGDANQQVVLDAVDRVARAARILVGDEGGDEL